MSQEKERSSTVEECRLPIRIDRVEPGQYATVMIEPALPWQPYRLVVPRDTGPHFNITRIQIGVVDQLVNKIRAPAKTVTDLDMFLDSCAPGLAISLTVENTTNEARHFRAWWEGAGPGAMSIPGAERVPIMRRCLMPIRLEKIEPGEHRTFEIGPVSGEVIVDSVVFPGNLYAAGLRFVSAAINGVPLWSLAAPVIDPSQLTRVMLGGDGLGPGDRLVLTFANLGIGDRPGPLDLGAALTVRQEWIPPETGTGPFGTK